MTKLYRHVVFAIEDGQRFEGFMPEDLTKVPFHGYWNGWLCPYVTEKTAKEIKAYFLAELKAWNPSDIEDQEADLHEFFDDYVLANPNADGLYNVGGYYIWSEVKE